MAFVIQQEGSVYDELYDQLEKAMAEATSLRREAFEESQRRDKAEKDLIHAHRRATAVESVYTEELKQRKEIEAGLLREKQELEERQNQRDEVIEEFCAELDTLLVTHSSDSEEYISDSEDSSESEICDEMVKKLLVKIVSVVRQWENYKKEQDELQIELQIERDELQIELDRTLKLTEELIQNQADSKGEAPEYFICPILQEVMKDPHVAADGFSYEPEAFREWLDSGHDTSPMTNLQLAHTNLVPNHTLRSGIQEWLQRQ